MYKAGQNVACKVLHAEKDGYAVLLQKDNLPGFIKTANKLEPGDEILGVFVCVHNGRVLLSQLFSAPREGDARRTKFNTVNWEELLREVDDELQGTDRPEPPKPRKLPSPSPDKPDKADKKPNTHRSKEEPGGGSSKPQGRLSVVPQSNVSPLTGGGGGGGGEIRHRRSIDIFVPPVDLKSIRAKKSFTLTNGGLKGLVAELEETKHNGCIKITSEQQNCRAAALLFGGRVLGCTYTCKDAMKSLSNEDALSSMLKSMQNPHCEVTTYTLPPHVILPMAALFIGQPVETNARLTAPEYFHSISNWIADNDSTACITLVHPEEKLMNLVFFFQGQAEGLFSIDTQKYTHNADATGQLFEKYDDTVVDACLLSFEDKEGNSRTDLGYSLSEFYSKVAKDK
jgi:hypothetical protein